jgi:hypothetical protein
LDYFKGAQRLRCCRWGGRGCRERSRGGGNIDSEWDVTECRWGIEENGLDLVVGSKVIYAELVTLIGVTVTRTYCPGQSSRAELNCLSTLTLYLSRSHFG